MFDNSPSRFIRIAAVLAVGAVTLVTAGTPTEARVDDAEITVISDGESVQDFQIAHNPDENEYFAVWRVAPDGDLKGALLDSAGEIIDGPLVVAERRANTTGTQLKNAGSWDPKIVYNTTTDQYLVLVQRNDAPPLTPAEDQRSATTLGRLISNSGALIGSEVRLSRRHGTGFSCINRYPDLVANPDTGGYTLIYSRWYGTSTDLGDVCEGLTPTASTTVIQQLSASLVRGAEADFPVINPDELLIAHVAHNPATGELLVTQPYAAGLRNDSNNDGRSFPVQRFDATDLGEVGDVVEVATAPPDASNISEAIPVADPVTGNYLLMSRSGPLALAFTNVIDSSGASLLTGSRIDEGRPETLVATGDGTYAMSTSSGKIVHVGPDGVPLHLATPFVGSNAEGPSAVALNGSSGVAIGYETNNTVVATVAVDIIAPGALSLPPARLLDTRDGAEVDTVDGEFLGGGKRDAGATIELDVAGRGGVADNAEAAVLNVAIAGPEAGGFATAYPCDAAQPTTSNVNYAAGGASSAAAFTKIAANGTVCIFTSARAHVIVDVNGYTPARGSTTPLVPDRLLDTRTTGDRPDAGSTTEVEVTGRAGVDDDADAVLVNVTAIRPSAQAFLTVYPCGSPLPTASNLNAAVGTVVNNLVLAKVGDVGRICVFSSAAAHLTVDVTAFVPAGGGLQSVVPARYLDSRPGGETVDGEQAGTGRLRAETEVRLDIANRPSVPGDGAGVMLNVVAIRPDTAGFLTIYPCGTDRPLASNLNFAADTVVANAVFVKLGSARQVCIYTSTGTHVGVDVTGFVVDE